MTDKIILDTEGLYPFQRKALAADYTGVEARLLATFGHYFMPLSGDELSRVYVTAFDDKEPKKDYAPWRKIPHKRGRMKTRRKR